MAGGMEDAVAENSNDKKSLKCDVTSTVERVDKDHQRRKIQSGLSRAIAVALVLVQTVWAVVIPAKNVVVMPYPKIAQDRVSVEQHKYDRDSDQIATRRIPGKQAYRIVQQVVELSLTNEVLRSFFESKSDFVIDEISHLLTPEQHQLFGQYYALLFQASEFPAGGVIPREQKVLVPDPDTNEEILITITCTRQQVFQGMRCVNPRGIMCDDVDWLTQPSNLTLTPIDLETLTNGTGWHNKVSTMGFITHTHDTMRALFSKKDWSKVFADKDMLPYEWRTWHISDSSVLRGIAVSMVSASPWNPWGMNDYLRAGIRKFDSCLNTEFLLGYHFAGFFAASLIQKTLIDLNLYEVTDLLNNSQTYDQIWDEMFQNDVLITHGAGHMGLVDDTKSFVGSQMTQVLTSTVNWKKDRPMTGPILMGSSPRNLEYWTHYSNIYYSYHNDALEGDTAVTDYCQLGGYHAGFNGFKYDFTRNTMGVLRLSERRLSKGTGYTVDWFEEEKQIAKWYRNHELNDPNSLIKMSEAIWDKDWFKSVEDPYCTEALYRHITQSVWIMALKKQPVMNHLVYQSMVDPDTPADWWYKQLSVNQIVGEQITGYRVIFPYFRDTYWVVDGESWVLIPLLNAFRKEFGEEKLLEDVMTEMNTSFFSLLVATEGKLMGFCNVGMATLGVTSTDSKQDLYNKLYGKLSEMIQKTISMVDTIHQQMISAGFHLVIPKEYVALNRTNNIFQYEGPPVYWTPTPLSVGLIRLATFVSPDNSQMQVLRDSLVCYDTLEWRFLNLSVRCWSEPQSIQETYEKTTSDGLRMLKFSMWSLGVVLNIIGAVVALRYAWRVWELWCYDRFSDMNMLLAVGMDFQGIGMISFDGVMIMAFSCVPLILSYHLPDDKVFMPSEKEKPNPVFAEFMVLLSLTWFIRLGIELGTYLISLKHYNWWFNFLTSRLRLTALVVVEFIRLALNLQTIDYNRGLIKLIASCVLSVVFGFVSVLVSVLFDQENTHSKDPLSRMMVKRHLARNVYGVLGQLRTGWTHAGMVAEGWKAFKIDGRVHLLMRGDLQWLPLETSPSEFDLVHLTPQILQEVQRGEKKLVHSVRVSPAHGIRVRPNPT